MKDFLYFLHMSVLKTVIYNEWLFHHLYLDICSFCSRMQIKLNIFILYMCLTVFRITATTAPNVARVHVSVTHWISLHLSLHCAPETSIVSCSPAALLLCFCQFGRNRIGHLQASLSAGCLFEQNFNVCLQGLGLWNICPVHISPQAVLGHSMHPYVDAMFMPGWNEIPSHPQRLYIKLCLFSFLFLSISAIH